MTTVAVDQRFHFGWTTGTLREGDASISTAAVTTKNAACVSSRPSGLGKHRACNMGASGHPLEFQTMTYSQSEF